MDASANVPRNDTYSGASKRVVTLGSRSRLGNGVADNANGNSKETRIEMEARICTAILEEGEW